MEKYFMPALSALEQYGIVPVVKLERSGDARPLAEALCAGGLPLAEVTFRTEAAAASIALIRRELPQMQVGAGTVVNLDQAKQALDAGAAFIVSPGFSPAIADFCRERQLPFFPGACTPTELIQLLDYGLPVAMFFPAAAFGGLSAIKALAAPFPGMRFMPTGGVGSANLAEYLSSPAVIACGGSWMVKDALIKAGDFAQITALTAQAVAIVKEAGR